MAKTVFSNGTVVASAFLNNIPQENIQSLNGSFTVRETSGAEVTILWEKTGKTQTLYFPTYLFTTAGQTVSLVAGAGSVIDMPTNQIVPVTCRDNQGGGGSVGARIICEMAFNGTVILIDPCIGQSVPSFIKELRKQTITMYMP